MQGLFSRPMYKLSFQVQMTHIMCQSMFITEICIINLHALKWYQVKSLYNNNMSKILTLCSGIILSSYIYISK